MTEVCRVPIIIKDNKQDSCIEFGLVLFTNKRIYLGETISIKIEEDKQRVQQIPGEIKLEQTFDNVEPHTTYQMTVEQAAKLYL